MKPREIAELIQSKTGESLVAINSKAFQLVFAGTFASLYAALNYMLELVNG